MRRQIAYVLLLALLLVPARATQFEAGAAPSVRVSPPGQVVIVTINARQHLLLGIRRFKMMYELSRALRRRPPAFDGGFAGSVVPADVIVVEEIRDSNLEIFQRLLEQRYDIDYTVVGEFDTRAGIIINPETVSVSGSVHQWEDPCFSRSTAPDERSIRIYQWAGFTELATNAGFTVAGVHWSKSYPESDCLVRNVEALKRELSRETKPVYVVGDFNRRATETPYECDPEEAAPPLLWWLEMTTGGPGEQGFIDTVRESHRLRGLSLVDEWTHEHKEPRLICDQTNRIRRTRIDYIFSSQSTTAEAHADHPGWSGGEPGTINPESRKYSDHRWVWGRFLLTGPPQPSPLIATPDAGGVIHLSWSTVDGVAEWILFRAVEGHSYDQVARLPSTQLFFDDTATEHGTTYRYSVAALAPTGGQGLESEGSLATADARGPHVRKTFPRLGETGVSPRVTIEVYFDDRVDPASVFENTVMLFKGDRRILGEVRQVTPRLLTLNPFDRLRKGANYHVVVRTVSDPLGNLGQKYSWGFRTVEPPPKKKRR